MYLYKIVRISLLAMLVIAGCTPSRTTDIEIFTDPDCIESCWRGLRPNTTSNEEISDFLEINNFTNIRLETNFEDDYSVILANHSDGYGFTAILQNNILSNLEISPTYTTTITLEKIIDNLGEPNYIRLGYSIDERSVENLEGYLQIYYPQSGFWFPIRGLTVNRLPNETVEVCVSEQNTVAAIYISAPIDIETMISTFRYPIRNVMDQASLEASLSNLTSWNNFGCQEFPGPQRN